MPRKEKKFNFINKTTNELTKRYYIGMHSTNDLEDGYLGSGKLLWYSIKKYGKEKHKREILEYFSDRKSLKKREKEIVNEDFLKDKNCMNIQMGGEGFGSSEEARKAAINSIKRQNWLRKNDPKWAKRDFKIRSKAMKRQFKDGTRKNIYWTGKKHKPETIERLKQVHKGRAIGEKNGSFGSKWIYNEELKESKRCKEDELSELLKIDGWKLGRKIKF